MPIFDFICDKCQIVKEIYIRNSETPFCCGEEMRKLPSYPGMVKIRGEGGYPHRVKQFRGSAAYIGER